MRTLEGHVARRPDVELEARPEHDSDTVVTQLVDQHSAMLQRVAQSVTHDPVEAEDVVQDTFLRVLCHRNKLPELRDPRVWLTRITWNLALDRKRRFKTRPQSEGFEEFARVLPSGELSAEMMMITGECHARILGLIDMIPAKEHDVLLLSAVNELTTIEIALALKTTESTIRSRLYRARQALAALLEQEGLPAANSLPRG